AKMPFAGEVGLIAALLQHRGERPFRRRQPAALALESYGSHPASIGNAAGLHRRASGRAAWLRVEREERDSFGGHAVDVGRRHATPLAATVGTEIAIAGVIRNDEQDIGFI